MRHHLKEKNVTLVKMANIPILVQICLVYPNYLDQKYNFPKSGFVTF